MLSRAQNKYIRSLTQQKYRKEYNVFLAEGDKIAREWLGSDAEIKIVVALEEWAAQHTALIGKHREAELCIVAQHELEAISALRTPNQVLLVVATPPQPVAPPVNEWCIALEGIQDPGNMGTIIRIADWFGIRHVVCSPDCADAYNPKVVQAAMGGQLRVQVHTVVLKEYLQRVAMPILAATLAGANIYEAERPGSAVLLIGNESQGLSADILAMATQQLTIPRRGGAESLNAAVSAGILCALLLR